MSQEYVHIDQREWSVSELSQALKNLLEETFPVVRVKGEISGYKPHSSGHLYFSLKDSSSLIDCVCWRGTAGSIKDKIADGLEIICTGNLSTYGARSRYQLVVEKIEIGGEGALLKLLQERKEKLLKEGLFDENRKKPLPSLPKVIGVITSKTGAVIRDILHRIEDRFPCHIILWPVAVQGEGAAGQIAGAIDGFNKILPGNNIPRPDLLIVARGGGSVEDLWCFNEEVVVRATANSQIPIISAVGHETDVTLIDYAADKRAPTPTAAAEMAVPVLAELRQNVIERGSRITFSLKQKLLNANQRLDDWTERLTQSQKNYWARLIQVLVTLRPRHPLELLNQKEVLIQQLKERLFFNAKRIMPEKDSSLNGLSQLLESYSHYNTLRRGFCLVKSTEGMIVQHKAQTKPGDSIVLMFDDGEQGAIINGASAIKKSKSPPKGQFALWD